MYSKWGYKCWLKVSPPSTPANTIHWPNTGWLLAYRLRPWPNIHPAFGQCIVFARYAASTTLRQHLIRVSRVFFSAWWHCQDIRLLITYSLPHIKYLRVVLKGSWLHTGMQQTGAILAELLDNRPGVIRSQHRVNFSYIPNEALYYKLALFGS